MGKFSLVLNSQFQFDNDKILVHYLFSGQNVFLQISLVKSMWQKLSRDQPPSKIKDYGEF